MRASGCTRQPAGRPAGQEMKHKDASTSALPGLHVIYLQRPRLGGMNSCPWARPALGMKTNSHLAFNQRQEEQVAPCPRRALLSPWNHRMVSCRGHCVCDPSARWASLLSLGLELIQSSLLLSSGLISEEDLWTSYSFLEAISLEEGSSD